MSLNSTVSLKISGKQSVAAGLADKILNVARSYNLSLLNGTTAGKADVIYHAQRTLIASANEDLDFAGGLTDPMSGSPVAFAKLKLLAIIAASGNTNGVVVKRPTTTGVPIFDIADASVTLGPNGVLLICSPGLAGYAVTPATGDVINVANSGAGTPVTYDVVALGTSA